jgi:hypothetical protein
MSLNIARKAAILATASVALSTTAVPASAAQFETHGSPAVVAHTLGDMTYEHKRKHRERHDRGYYGRGDRYYGSYGEPVYRDTRIWRGRDGRYYCRRENGTTGLLIGAGVGALAGHEIAGRGGDRTLGAILGAAGGAILGRAIDRSDTRCR